MENAKEAVKILEIARSRRSIRKYLQKPVEDWKLEAVLEAGRIAPSATNAQMWKFVAVRDPRKIEKLVNACNNQKFVGDAPVFIAVCTDGEERDMACGQPARTVDCSIAMSFMLLASAELGLGTCWLGNFSNERVKRVLDIPESANVVAVTPLGYAAEEPAMRPRRPASEVICYDGWK